MNLDDLQAAWQDHDRKLDALVRLNRELVTSSHLSGARTSLRRLGRYTVVVAVMTWVVIPLMGWFIAINHTFLRFVIPAVLLQLYCIINMVVLLRQTRAVSKVDYGQPVTVIQKQLSALVRLRIRYAQWLLMTMVLAWVPLSIVGARALFKADLYALAPYWLVTNAMLGLAFIPLTIALSKRYAQGSPSTSGRRLVRDIAGVNLTAALDFVDTLGEFEHEPSASTAHVPSRN